MNLCRTCGEDFGSVDAFDRHRVGKYLQTGPAEYRGPAGEWTPNKGRRCLDEKELRERGFRKNARGAWSLARDIDRGRILRELRRAGRVSAQEATRGLGPVREPG
jgi:hypothetical protein